MDFELKYNLIQQTPLIHFQHDQKGATLRSTEVKPKLDRFIIKKMGAKENIPENWFVGETNALNYKMRIVATEEPSYVKLGLKTDYDIFYGNTGDSTSEKKGVLGNCLAVITCFVPELRKKINEVINEFFIVTNFGTMQNKGFGSFIVYESDTSPAVVATYLKAEYGAKECYCFTSAAPGRFNSNGDKRFKDIKTVYGVMKSGINFGSYHRSFLFEYCHEVLKMGNEKAAMKQNEVSPWANNEPVKKPTNERNFWNFGGHDYKYVRSILGIGERIEYITGFYYDEKPGKNGRPRGWVANKEKEVVKISNSEIERFASPIKFKVIGEKVYFFASRINPKILNQSFTFTNSHSNSISLNTPERFDIDDFLHWFVNKYNLESLTRDRRNNLPTYSIGKKIEVVNCREEV